MLDNFELFDSHFHIVDSRYPLIPNNGYLPGEFTVKDYQDRLSEYNVCGGVIVSGSFQAFDHTYLVEAIKQLGDNFFGVVQLPASATDDEIIQLDRSGIRGIRFNLKRGGSEEISYLESMAKRVYELVEWHIELYLDSGDLDDLYPILSSLPAVSIDHLGLSKTGFNLLLKLVEQGIKVKVSGFSRTDFDVKQAIKDLYSANPNALLFGTDLPSTRAPQAYSDDDFKLVVDTLDAEGANRILSLNALDFYRQNKEV